MSTLEKAIELLQKMSEQQVYAVYMFALFVNEHPDILNPDSLRRMETQKDNTKQENDV